MNRKVWTSLLVIGMALAAIAGGTLAWFTAQAEIKPNIFTAGTLDIEADETFEYSDDNPLTNWNPGDCTDKEVTVKITGTKRAYLRMQFNDGWYELDENEQWVAWEPTADVIIMKVNGNEFPTANWVLIDGWYYYVGAEGPENAPETVITVITKVCLDGSAENDFQGKQYRLGFNFEAIQVTHEAVFDKWSVGYVNGTWVKVSYDIAESRWETDTSSHYWDGEAWVEI